MKQKGDFVKKCLWTDVGVENFFFPHIKAAGSLTRSWHFPFLDPNGDLAQLIIKLHEPSYIGNDIGFKTWGAAPLLAK